LYIAFIKQVKAGNYFLLNDGLTNSSILIIFIICTGFTLDIFINLVHNIKPSGTIVSTMVVLAVIYSLLTQNVTAFNDYGILSINNLYAFADIREIKSKSSIGRVRVNFIVKYKHNKTKNICIRISDENFNKLNKLLKV
jgi:hypothetical protein